MARPGRGKSGGWRTLIAANRADRWIFVFGFPKSARGNVDPDEETALKRLAAHLLGLAPAEVEQAVAAGELNEVKCNAKDEVRDS